MAAGTAAQAAGALLFVALILLLLWPKGNDNMATQPKPAGAKDTAKDVEASLLADTHIEGVLYRAGGVVRVPVHLAKAHEARGELDLAPEAIAARKADGAVVVIHQRAEQSDT